MTDRDPFAGMAPQASAAQRRAHRRARLIDAARLLPALGVALFLAPDLLLSGGDGTGSATAPWLIYLFIVWALLIGLSGFLARRISQTDPRPDPEASGDTRDGP